MSLSLIKNLFIGAYVLTKLVRTFVLGANNIKSLENYFEDNLIDQSKAWFACMDTTNVNYGADV